MESTKPSGKNAKEKKTNENKKSSSFIAILETAKHVAQKCDAVN